jgi:plasmid stabilization system protein ParE
VSERDYLEVIQRSAQDFGPLQAEAYAQTLASALDALREKGPMAIGVKEREEIGSGIFTLLACIKIQTQGQPLFGVQGPRGANYRGSPNPS